MGFGSWNNRRVTITCQMCGVSVATTARGAKYCPACSVKRRRTQAIASGLRARAKKKALRASQRPAA